MQQSIYRLRKGLQSVSSISTCWTIIEIHQKGWGSGQSIENILTQIEKYHDGQSPVKMLVSVEHNLLLINRVSLSVNRSVTRDLYSISSSIVFLWPLLTCQKRRKHLTKVMLTILIKVYDIHRDYLLEHLSEQTFSLC